MIANNAAACLRMLTSAKLSLPLAVMSLLAACASPPPPPEPVDRGTINQPPPALPAEPEQAFDTDALSQVTDVALSTGTLAARIERNDILSRGLDATTLALINARLAWLDGDVSMAMQQLDSAATANVEGRELVLAERQSIAAQQRQWLSAAKFAWQRGKLQPDQSGDRGDELFANLMRLTEQQLLRAQLAGGAPEWAGWVDLALAYRGGREQVLSWIASHDGHPAIDNPPAALNRWLTQQPPAKVALLLPLSGRLQQAGEAVLEGAVQSLYERYREAGTRPELITIDTTSTSDALTAYRRAVSAGADFVIGPLTRERVEAASMMGRRSVPQLALNRPASLLPGEAEQWAAISLSPEDEARQLADLAFGDGRRRAVIVRPDSDWGRRLEAALVDRWRSLGGRLVSVAEIEPQVPATQTLSNTLGAADSEQRITAVEDAFAAPVSARARRRADFDVIFLMAPDPATARELRPLLVYHYAGDVPVFGPASVYSGNQQARNQDLNGLVFVETPAVLQAATVDRFTRLRALGNDAVLMMDHWQQTQASATAVVSGKSGMLSRQPDGSVRRELIATRFDGDNIEKAPLP